MREIKFRAWNKLKREMDEVYTIHWGFDRTRGTWRNETFGGDGDNIELMQYTGLKDKNGKEIYEGDVVQDSELQQGPVIFEDGFFYARFSAIDWDYLHEIDVDVIGNIYETPAEVTP